MKRLFRLGSTLPLLVLLGACGRSRPADLPETPHSALPITRVVLYQNGVGYFEREGTLEGNRLTLQVRPSQINDLLKSLTIVDRSSGRALSVSLPLEKSADQALSELPEQVRHASGLLELLTVFRGARVEVSGAFGTAEGRVVGLENIPDRVPSRNEAVAPRWRLTLAEADGELRVLALEDVRSLTILDRALAVGLERSLDVSLKEGDWKPVSITVRFTGDEDHPLKASYVVEMPRWKPAYRVVLSDNKPLLQGWAVVDNVSGEDWTNVELSLVAGTPVSFIYDLHSSQFVRRTDLSPRRLAAAPPPPVEAGGSSDEEAEAEEMASFDYAAKAHAPMLSKRLSADYESEDDEEEGIEAGVVGGVIGGSISRPPPPPIPRMDEQLQSQFVAETQTEQVGSLFRYDLKSPVNVPDRTSTLVNIINERVSAAEVAMFRPSYPDGPLPTHPYRAVRLTNDTPFTLEQGPVTIYSEGTFVGEGFLERVEPKSTHFIGFSLDSKVSLNSDSTLTSGDSRLVRISGGVFTLEEHNRETIQHDFRNQHAEPITAFLKTSRRSGWSLAPRPAGIIETPDALWVPVELPANGTAKLELTWEQKGERRTTIDTDLDAQRLVVTLKNTKLPPQLEAALQQILAVKAEGDEVNRQIQHQNQLKASLESDQRRVRDNLDTLRKTKGNAALQQTLAQKLSKLEQELGVVSGKLVELIEKRAELSKQLIAMVRSLEF